MHWRGKYQILAGSIGFMLLLVLVLPHSLSVYHLEAGGRALDRVVNAATLADCDLTARGVKHIETARYWQKNNTFAYRLLAKAHLLQGDLVEASIAAAQYANQRTDDPQAWWELARVYDTIEARLEVADSVNLMEPFATRAQRDSESNVKPASHLCLCQWEMPLASAGQPQELKPVQTKVSRPVLSMQTPAQLDFTITVPITATVLTFWMGVDPQSWAVVKDGVNFQILVDSEQVFSRFLTANQARQGWWPGKVDLRAWASREIELTIATSLVSVSDDWSLWVGWRDVKLINPDMVPYVDVAPEQRFLAAWHAGGFTTQDLLAVGEEKRKGQRYEEAIRWYQRAMHVEPGLGDPWYYMGLLHEDRAEWSEGLKAYRKALESEWLKGVGRSSIHYRIGFVHQKKMAPRQLDIALAAYDQALATNSFGDDAEVMDSHYQRGVILWEMGSPPEEYLAKFLLVTNRWPDHASGHVMLGVAYYEQFGDVERAETEIQYGLELSPENEWAYYHLGEIYCQDGQVDRARAMYEQALRTAPDFKLAQDRLRNCRVNR